MLFYIFFSLSHCRNFFCILFRYLQFKFLFQGHYQFNQVKGVGIEILSKRSAWDDLAFFNTKLLDNNIFETFTNCCHYFTSLSASGVGCCCALLNIVPRTPLINRLEVLLPKILASSTASLIAAFAGTVLLNRIS